MKGIVSWGAGLGLAALLAACAVTPVRHYSLTVPATNRPALDGVSFGARGGLGLSVTRIPAEAERPQLVVRDPARDPAVQVLNDSLWAAPLSDQITDALAAGVGRRLDDAGLPPGAPHEGSRASRRIEVRIDRFDMVWGRFVALDAAWTDREPGTTDHSRSCRASIRLPAGEGVAVLVEAQRQALDCLAAQIAAAALGQPMGLHEDTIVSEFGCT